MQATQTVAIQSYSKSEAPMCCITLNLNSPQGFANSCAAQKRTLLPVSYSSQCSGRTRTPDCHLLAVDNGIMPVNLTPTLPSVKASWRTPEYTNETSDTEHKLQKKRHHPPLRSAPSSTARVNGPWLPLGEEQQQRFETRVGRNELVDLIAQFSHLHSAYHTCKYVKKPRFRAQMGYR